MVWSPAGTAVRVLTCPVLRVLWELGQNHWNVKNDFMASLGQVLLVSVSQVVVGI